MLAQKGRKQLWFGDGRVLLWLVVASSAWFNDVHLKVYGCDFHNGKVGFHNENAFFITMEQLYTDKTHWVSLKGFS